MAIAVRNFDYVRDFVYRKAAIVLDDNKGYRVESRLQPVARRNGLESLAEMVVKLRTRPQNGIHWDIVEAMPPIAWFLPFVPAHRRDHVRCQQWQCHGARYSRYSGGADPYRRRQYQGIVAAALLFVAAGRCRRPRVCLAHAG